MGSYTVAAAAAAAATTTTTTSTTTTIFSVFSIYSVVTKIYKCENKDITNSPRAVHTCDTLRKNYIKKEK